MLVNYFSDYFLTLMLIIALLVMVYVNKKLRIPAAKLFYVVTALLFTMTVLEFLHEYVQGNYGNTPPKNAVQLRITVDMQLYILRPVIILLQLLFIIRGKTKKLLCCIPAAANTVIYASVLFGSHIGFWIDESNHWARGQLGLFVYICQFIYIVLLLIVSAVRHRKSNRKLLLIIMIVGLIAVLTTVLEYKEMYMGHTTEISAFGVLVYYIYLSAVNQQSMCEMIEEKELRIAQENLHLIRSRIQPHFIFDSLSIIRSLARQDKHAAVSAIDSFSSYLRTHLLAVRDDKLISFTQDLECAKAYLSLSQADAMTPTNANFDLDDCDFELPPLTLEPIIGQMTACGGKDLNISTDATENSHIIRISTMQTDTSWMNDSSITYIHRRLESLCSGTLNIRSDESGTAVTIEIPLSIE